MCDGNDVAQISLLLLFLLLLEEVVVRLFFRLTLVVTVLSVVVVVLSLVLVLTMLLLIVVVVSVGVLGACSVWMCLRSLSDLVFGGEEVRVAVKGSACPRLVTMTGAVTTQDS